MSSDRVTPERLHAEIKKRQDWLRNNSQWFDKDQLIELREVVAMLLELQSRRAAEQAALPEVEEMAEKSAWNCEVATYPPAKSSVTKPVIAAALTPLYAKLAEHAKVLGECREYIGKWTVCHADASKGYCVGCDLSERIDALLGAKGGGDGKDQ